MEQLVPHRCQCACCIRNAIAEQKQLTIDNRPSAHWSSINRVRMTRDEYWAIQDEDRRRIREASIRRVCAYWHVNWVPQLFFRKKESAPLRTGAHEIPAFLQKLPSQTSE